MELEQAEQAAAQAVEQEQEQPLPRQNTPPTSASSSSSAPANPFTALAETEPAAMVNPVINYDARGETEGEKEPADIMSKIGHIRVKWDDEDKDV